MKKLLTVGVAMVLTACGGGGSTGGGSTSAIAPPPPVTAEGFWEGTASNGPAVALAVLEDGETWGIYTSGAFIAGALYGVTSSSGTALTGSGKDFNIPARSVTNATYTGSFVAKSSIRVTTSGGVTFSGNYVAAYDQPASLTTLAGTFSGQGVSGNSSTQTIPVTISASGAITVPTSAGCGASGTASPRASGKNIFDVSVTFNGTSCALGNGTVTKGVGYFNSTNRSLLVLALNPAKTDGFIYVGQK